MVMNEKTTLIDNMCSPLSVGLSLHQVQAADLDPLRHNFWPQRSAPHCREMLERVLYAQEQGRGLGVVVSEVNSPGALLAYGQYLRWTRCAEISDLIVAEAYRNRGIGTAIIRYLLAQAINAGITCVEIGAANSNPRALALYRRLGFVDKQTLSLDVGQGPEPVTYLQLQVPEPSHR